MRIIHEYHLKPEQMRESFILHLPRDAQIRHFGLQRELFTLWVEIDNEAPMEPRRLGMFKTGSEIPIATRYIGTVKFTYGLIWHLYEHIIP